MVHGKSWKEEMEEMQLYFNFKNMYILFLKMHQPSDMTHWVKEFAFNSGIHT